jgi:outer membrane lipoprotein SlyB
MQTAQIRTNPLLTVAAISVIVLSAVGVAALTGMIPASKGQENVLELPKEVAKPIEPAITHAPAPAKPALRRVAPRPVEPVVFQQTSEVPQVVQPAKPVLPVGDVGVVESVREVKEAGEAKGLGAIAGGVVGGVLGNKLGKGKALGTLLGAAGGAFAGHQVEKHVRADKHWEIAVRLDDGSQRTLTSDAEPAWHAGDRVRIVDGKLERS